MCPWFITLLMTFFCTASKKLPLFKKHASLITSVQPIGPNQKRYFELLSNSSVPLVVATGPAGCGKTLLACDSMIQALEAGLVDKLVITRPHVAVDGEELGFLPGSITKKMEPWTHPVFDLFGSYLSSTKLQGLLKEGVIEVVPLGFMRGRTFDRCWVLADEMQNSSPNQMLMLLTRLGKGSRMTLTGDLAQSDLAVGANGLSDFLRRSQFYPHDDIGFVSLDGSDVQRSLLVSRLLELWDATGPV